jgi:uncharacterized paraquat-inducible protein A
MAPSKDWEAAPRSLEEVVAAVAGANPGRSIIDCPGCGLIFPGPPAGQVRAVACPECGHTAADVDQVTVNPQTPRELR